MPARAIREPYKFNIPLIRAAVEIALDETAKEVVEDFGRSYQTWQVHKPRVEVIRETGKRGIIVTDSVYGFVNFGTQVRYAVMTNPFYPKTTPGTLSAGSGVGKMAYISKSPRAGIAARRFDMIIAEIAQETLVNRMTSALNVALSKRL